MTPQGFRNVRVILPFLNLMCLTFILQRVSPSNNSTNGAFTKVSYRALLQNKDLHLLLVTRSHFIEESDGLLESSLLHSIKQEIGVDIHNHSLSK